MRRFNYDENDEFKRDVDNFLRDDIGDENEIIESQINYVNRDMNYRVLRTSIRMCENSFLWKFYSNKTRLSMIEETYKSLIKKIEE